MRLKRIRSERLCIGRIKSRELQRSNLFPTDTLINYQFIDCFIDNHMLCIK